ncbi:uncharacterized protein PAC_17245 [Phialocephala subalpina]|uniref:Uncharacterized protein n=1 Tax=Phialocephala subalpina TaxID=576137 RepID=A0A1L7XQL9_9HELO|nr:uncharacterized protein PAC_17245 [Phialocephala subalpina]
MTNRAPATFLAPMVPNNLHSTSLSEHLTKLSAKYPAYSIEELTRAHQLTLHDGRIRVQKRDVDKARSLISAENVPAANGYQHVYKDPAQLAAEEKERMEMEMKGLVVGLRVEFDFSGVKEGKWKGECVGFGNQDVEYLGVEGKVKLEVLRTDEEMGMF